MKQYDSVTVKRKSGVRHREVCTCPYCPFTVKSRGGMPDHVVSVHLSLAFVCGYCMGDEGPWVKMGKLKDHWDWCQDNLDRGYKHQGWVQSFWDQLNEGADPLLYKPGDKRGITYTPRSASK